MAEWGVFYRELEVFPHDNADSLEVVRAGNYQFVSRKGTYQSGDKALVIPEKAVLTGRVKEEYQDYLVGPNKDRVKGIKLRGELSMGILMSEELSAEIFGLKEFSEDIDYAETLGIIKYEPPIPQQLAGKVKVFPSFSGDLSKHDVEHLSVYRDALEDDDVVVVTEKIHGSQVVYTLTENGDFIVSSKGLFSRGMCLEDEPGNSYWVAAHTLGMEDRLKLLQKENDGATVQAFGEIIPVQQGFGYGVLATDALIYDIRVDGRSYSFDGSIPAYFMEIWVPVIVIGRFGDLDMGSLCKGMETVSGKELHIREGVVVRPLTMRYAKDGTRLHLKVINPKYKESGEEIN